MSGIATRAIVPVVLLALAGCGVSLTPPEELPTPWGAAVTPEPPVAPADGDPLGFSDEEIAAVRILNDGCKYFATGSGFAIDTHTVVTNRHVVRNFNELSATMYDGTPLTITESYLSKVGDLAVLTVEEELPSVVTLADANPELSTAVRVVGYPDGRELTTTDGTILALVDDQLKDEGKVFSTSAKAEPGSSGSAAYDDEGNVVGVLYAGDDYGTTFIVPVETLRDLFDNAERQKNNKRKCNF